MTDELKPVRCGCGGKAMLYVSPITTRWLLQCESCKIETTFYDTEAEAIEAWNRAMGGKTAKVVTEGKPIEGSDNYIAVTSCGECGNVVSLFDRYCSGCGCRLEWK